MRRLTLALVLAAGAVVVAGQEPEPPALSEVETLQVQLHTATERVAELEAALTQTRARLAYERRMTLLAIVELDRRLSALEAERGPKAPGKVGCGANSPCEDAAYAPIGTRPRLQHPLGERPGHVERWTAISP